MPRSAADEKEARLGPLSLVAEPADVLALKRTIESLRQENAWLRAELARLTKGYNGKMNRSESS